MAERELTSDVLTAIGQGVIRPVVFFEGAYDDGSGGTTYLRLFTGVGTLSWDGKTWVGGGNLLAISPWRETTGLEAVGFSVTLSGLPASLLALALASLRKNKPGKLWLGFFDSTGALIADPYLARRGKFDMAPISRDGDTVTIEARYEDRLVDLDRPRERRYTSQDQVQRLATDKGFDQVPELQDARDFFGPIGVQPGGEVIVGGSGSTVNIGGGASGGGITIVPAGTSITGQPITGGGKSIGGGSSTP